MAGENDQFLDRERQSVVPPPPTDDTATAEVSIRTMSSDIALLSQTGGSTPQGEAVSISFEHGKKQTSSKIGAGKSMPVFVWIALAVCAAVVLFTLGFYLLPQLLPSSSPSDANVPNGVQNQAAGSLPDTSGVVFTTHESFFKNHPADSLSIQLLPNGTEGTHDRFAGNLSGTHPIPSFAEVIIVNSDGHSPSWAEFMENQHIAILPREFFAAHFEPDFTAFLTSSGVEARIGYVLKLVQGETPLTVSADLRSIEQDPLALTSLLVNPPASTSGTVFHDGQVVGQPIRSATFPDGSVLAYGWFYNQYLVIGTSLEGIQETVQRL